MDGIANVARHQQTQLNSTAAQGRAVEHNAQVQPQQHQQF